MSSTLDSPYGLGYGVKVNHAGTHPSIRQPPGSACQYCRNKKLKCDARQPQCGTCLASGVECIRSTHSRKRGSRKDHMKVLQDRIDVLEQDARKARSSFTPDLVDMDFHMQSFDLPTEYDPFENISDVPPFSESMDPLPPLILDDKSDNVQPHHSIQPISFPGPSLDVSDLMDQLYLERTHHLAPILHRQHYFSWTRSPTKTEAQVCLQYAMWTLAGSLSSQLQHVCESFYQHTCSLLDVLSTRDNDLPQIEYVQACILILYYDQMKKSFRRGWTSAGRCIRAIQLMRLFEVDRPQGKVESGGWIHKEEKRRAFWVVYSLDIFISLQGEWPLSLLEHTNFIRLPAPECDFQNGRSVEMPFLATVLSSNTSSVFSPFTESIIFATIIRRVTTNTCDCSVKSSKSVWEKQISLNMIVQTRLKALSSKYQNFVFPLPDDPMHMFTMMLAQASVLYLYSMQHSLVRMAQNNQSAILTLEHESLLAAGEILSLSTSILNLSFLKVHPFTPLLLAKCIEFYNTYYDLDEFSRPPIQ
ncbi:hypothetical protein N7537_010695 [Penicillium hordei]|uniref:Zn(2)-C6 fungal-type domain-containing protein n=1 Tax=Penicillium hordei TaxID=40994 RepID=A0AAD6GVW8_9EURO|nr:uncharacterized protein N7537_010695 [Penicillium hordei]KAJ5593791.1 hypothetical protein N7537_010695 [Penicillium hordei]